MTSDDGHNRIPSAIYEAQTTSWKSNSSLQPAIRPKRNEQQRCDIDDTRSSAMCAICGGCHHAQVLLNKQQPSSNDITTHNEKSRQRRSKNCRRPRSLLAELQISLFWVRIRLETLDQQTRIRCVDNTFHSHRRFVMFVCASHSFVAPESVYWPSVFRVFFLAGSKPSSRRPTRNWAKLWMSSGADGVRCTYTAYIYVAGQCVTAHSTYRSLPILNCDPLTCFNRSPHHAAINGLAREVWFDHPLLFFSCCELCCLWMIIASLEDTECIYIWVRRVCKRQYRRHRKCIFISWWYARQPAGNGVRVPHTMWWLCCYCGR